MKWSWFSRAALGLMSAVALGLSMTACGGGTIAYLWAVGSTPASGTAQGSGIVVGYKVDNYTGNLTAVPGQPFGSNGSNPVQVVVRPGGRFLYVINQGTGYTGSSTGSSEGIDEFAIGGEGSLTFEQHYDTTGYGHLWATFDTSGGYFYVLDKYSPTYQPNPNMPNYDTNGAIFAFTSDANTGRLFPAGQNNFEQPNQPAPLYVEVGTNPLRMASNGSCLFTVNSSNQTVSIFSLAGGQLGTVTTGVYQVQGAQSITSITTNGGNLFLSDNRNGAGPGVVFNYTVANCALTPFTVGPAVTEDSSTTNPQNVFVSTRGQYVYVLNADNYNTTATTQGSTLSAYFINNATLSPISGSPFPNGPGPYCMVEDPTSKYVYTSNSGDGSISGWIYDDTHGTLQPLLRGSNFKTSALNLSCMAISGTI